MQPEKLAALRKGILIELIFLLGIFRAIGIFGIRGADCPSKWLVFSGPCQYFNVNMELILWAVPVLLLGLEILWERDWKGYLQTCKRNWFVLLFVLIAAASLIWSINFYLTFYKLIILLISTLMAIYLGHAYSLEKILKSLSWFFIIISFACLAFVIFLPDIGIMRDPFYKGAWSGIFWHRNYLGCFMALGASIYLINILKSQKRLTVAFAIDIVMLGITLFLLVKSKSATGILTGMVLAALVVVFYVWEKVQIILTRVHYYGFLGAAVVAIMLILTRLDFIFGLLGRNTTLTGRVPMWKYLFENLIIQRLWLGYGYGALWHLRGIREEIARQVGWSYEVLIGDNGFIDIQLHLGIVGLAVIFGLIILGFIHGKRYLLQQRTLESAFPILLLVFVLVANISLSLILESETLIWIVSLAVIISVQNRFQKQPE